MGRAVAFVRLSVLLLVLLATASEGKRTFQRCELARYMDDLDVPRDDLAIWACIAEHESSYRTWVIGPPNTDGSRDHGIFQINDRYWCLPDNGQVSSNGCHVDCAALRTDHIDAAVRCAVKIQRLQGWTAWSVYGPHCSGRLPSIEDCFGSGSSYFHGAGVCGKW